MLLRFVGSDSEIGQIRIHEFGTQLDLDAQTAHDAVMSRVGLVTEPDFQTANITDEELTQFTDRRQHVDSPEAFRQKVAKLHKIAATMHHEYVTAAATGDTFMARSVKPAPKPVQMTTSAPRVDLPAPREQ